MKTPMQSLLAGGWLALSLTTTAHAGLLDMIGDRLFYSDPGGINNQLRIMSSGGTYYLSDPADLNIVITQKVIDAGCFVGILSIGCPATSIAGLIVDGGAGTDTIDLT